MPRPGFEAAQHTVIEPLASSGTIINYGGTIATDFWTQTQPAGGPSGTIFGTVTGTVVAALMYARAIGELASAQVLQVPFDTGSVIGARVLQVGKAIGTLTGSVSGVTVTADSNAMLVQFYVSGTVSAAGRLNPVPLAAGGAVVGTIVVQEWGR